MRLPSDALQAATTCAAINRPSCRRSVANGRSVALASSSKPNRGRAERDCRIRMRTWWAKALIVVSRGFCQSSSQEAAKILAKTIWSLYTGDAFSGSPEQMTYRPVRSTERNPASANCLRYWLAAAFLRPTNSPAWTTCSSRLGDVAISRSSDNRISLLRTRQIFQNSILLPFAAVVYHTFHLKTIVCKQWFSHAPPICGGRWGMV